jgi:hypothetical protein
VDPTAFEEVIFTAASRRIDVSNNVRSYEDRLAELHLLHGLGNIKAETKKALGDFKVLVSTWNQHLSTRIDALRASYKELRSFQQEHGLSRPFKEVESRWVHSSAILGAWFVETAGNTFFLSAHDEMGIIGGVVAAASRDVRDEFVRTGDPVDRKANHQQLLEPFGTAAPVLG